MVLWASAMDVWWFPLFNAPWAVGANGKKLPTSYSLDGDLLTQRVQTAGATYPVLVGPNITFGIPSVALNLWGYEIRAIVGASTSVLTGGIGAGCQFISKLPFAVKAIAKGIYFVAGIGTLKAALEAAINAANAIQVNTGQCYQLALVSLGNSWKAITSGCRGQPRLRS